MFFPLWERELVEDITLENPSIKQIIWDLHLCDHWEMSKNLMSDFRSQRQNQVLIPRVSKLPEIKNI